MERMKEFIVHTPHVRRYSIIAVLITVLIAVTAAIVISVTNIGGDEVGIVRKRFGGGKLSAGRFIAVDGENGIQASVLMPGWHFFYWPWQYSIDKVPMVQIKEGHVGILQAQDGISLPTDTIYAPEWENPDLMKQAKYFLGEGQGYKGPQLSVLTPGVYPLNTELFKIKQVPIVDIKTGTVAVIKSNVGESVPGGERLVDVGQRGIWRDPKTEGQYFLNTDAYEVTIVSIRQTKVSYTKEQELGEGRSQPLRPITVRSSDGFTFPVDVRMTYKIDPETAPRVVAMIGDDDLVLNKLVTPRVRATFRDNAEKVKALAYVQNRSTQGQQSTEMLREELASYGITVLEISIGDVGDVDSLGQLLKTQMDREIALQEQTTFEEQQRAAEKQKALTRTTQEAEEEKRLATAAYGVKMAEEDKKKLIIDAQAEAEQIQLVAEAKAKAYEKIAGVIGPGNAALIEILKLVASEHLNITPSVMVGGSSGAGMSDALMGTILKGMLEQPPVENQ
ncbi:SPFH domain-containing protein [Planctomycetota bacterium]